MRPVSASTLALIALLLAVPLGLALLLPAPSSDTRELLSWGLYPSLSTPKQPPLMQWMGALVMRFAWPTTFWCVALGQVLNAAGLAYVYATMRLWLAREPAALMTLLLTAAVYFTAAPVAFALNADILQFPFWAAMLFHAERAFATRRLAHWLVLALAFALAFYAKYTVALLAAAIAAASLAAPTYRSVWRDARLYLTALLGALLIAPHLIALPHSGALGHATGTLDPTGGVGYRLKNLGELATGFVAYLAPAWIFVAAAVVRGEARVAVDPGAAPAFVRATTGAALALLVVLVLGLGFKYPSRYDSPFLFLGWLAIASVLSFKPLRFHRAQRWLEAGAAAFGFALLIGAGLIYGVFTIHPRQQEPLRQAAAKLQAEWRSRFTCGPAYVMGDFWSAYGIGISLDPPRPGVHLIEMQGVPGYDPARREREGAILIYRDRIHAEEARAVFPELDLGAAEQMTLPFAPTLSRKAEMTYSYLFVAPKGC